VQIITEAHWYRNQVSAVIRASTLFATLDDAILCDLESEVQLCHLAGREVLFRQGNVGDALYVVISGRLQVFVEREDRTKIAIGQIGVGDVVGEMALIGGERRTATVQAIRDTHLAQLSRAAFDRLIARHPHALLRFFGSAAIARAREQLLGQKKSTRPPKTLAVIAAEPNSRVTEFCSQLVSHVAAIASVGLISKQIVAAHLDLSDAQFGGRTQEMLTDWLNERERETDFLVYEGDDTDPRWNEQMLRQSDHVLLLANGSSYPPSPHSSLTEAVQKGVQFSVVLLHPSGVKPLGSSRWLDAYEADRVHHVHEGSYRDFERLVRFLTGGAFGIVLGGGFARGIAHAGAIRALNECGVPIDLVGGTSSGGLVALECAMGFDYEQLVETTYAGFETCFKDVTVPFISVLTGRNIARYIESVVGETQIEDLPIPFFCVSANLNRARSHMHIRGSIMRSLLATARAPGVFPPMVENGELLVDGGIADNVPVAFMKTFANGGPVIASDVSTPGERTNCDDYGLAVSGWKWIARKLNPFTSTHYHVPRLDYTLMRTIEFGGVAARQQAMQLADLYIRAPLDDFRVNDFKKGRRMAEAAYEYAKPRIEEWLRTRSKGKSENVAATRMVG
jgi:NTE family protein